MEIRSSEEVRENVKNFSKAYIKLLKEKKALDADIKALKDDYKEDGVAVGIVCSQINKIKSDKKKSESQKFEADTIREWLESDADIDSDIGELMAD